MKRRTKLFGNGKEQPMKERGFKYVFPVIAAILWIAVFIMFFKEHSSFASGDYAARKAAETDFPPA